MQDLSKPKLRTVEMIAFSGILLQAMRRVTVRKSRLRRIADIVRGLSLKEPHRSILRAVRDAQTQAERAVACQSGAA